MAPSKSVVPAITTLSHVGEANAVTLLLSDWSNFGLSERVCYHVDLLSTPSVAKESTFSASDNADVVQRREGSLCGVAGLLECVPKVVPKYHRRALKTAMRNFNLHAQHVRSQRNVPCHEPRRLPIALSSSTRISFAYEITKIAFCLDASPSLVATFGGHRLGGNTCCALDKLSGMVQTFFKSLVEPVQAPSLEGSHTVKSMWKPILAVTVIAVFPRGTGPTDTSLLVRDFRVHDQKSASCLSENISRWALGEIEDEIAARLSYGGTAFSNPLSGYDTWKFSTYSSFLKDILDAGDVALSLLPSHARPCIVVATDCRSMVCESTLEVFADTNRIDTPLVVLDLSSSCSSSLTVDAHNTTDPKFFSIEAAAECTYPLHLSDDSEQLYVICRATGGCFMDESLLEEASTTYAGMVSTKSSLSSDPYFSVRRRSLRLNGTQNYVLLSLSPLTPLPHPHWGNLNAPLRLRVRSIPGNGIEDSHPRDGALQKNGTAESYIIGSRRMDRESCATKRDVLQKAFSTYVVSPVAIKNMLLMRIKEGYRVKQYGQSTQDLDKLSLQLILPLELDTMVHYEISYTALREQRPMVGVAHVKIELSGEARFIQLVKNDFLSGATVQKTLHPTIARERSDKLCKILRALRREDYLQSYFCPLSWEDKFSGTDCPFARRLGTLSHLQRHRHFRLDQFDVVLVGRMPYERDEHLLLNEFVDESGMSELVEALSSWSSHRINERRFVKTKSCDFITYCVVEVIPSAYASRLWTVKIKMFGVGNATIRLEFLDSLYIVLSALNGVTVLQKQMNEYLVGLRNPISPSFRLVGKQRFLESHFHYECWDGVKDRDLLALLTRRRSEVGEFWFLHSSDLYSLFAKLVCVVEGRLVTADVSSSADSSSSDLYQVQYQIAVLEDKVVIDMHVEREQGVFFIESRHSSLLLDIFDRVKKHDQECGRALRSRTNLLRLFDDPSVVANVSDSRSYITEIEHLLKYASQDTRQLRFFRGDAQGANDELLTLTTDSFTSSVLAMQVSLLHNVPIAASIDGFSIGPGLWFLIQFDRHTLSIAHLSSENEQNDADAATRILSFFTVGVSDLYCKRDVVADDDSTDDHISEYLCVSQFADAVEASHRTNFARAAYLAMRNESLSNSLAIHRDDFQFVLEQCSFVQAASSTVAGGHANLPDHESRLTAAFEDVLKVVPGEENYLFFSGNETSIAARNALDLLDEAAFLCEESDSYEENESLSETELSQISEHEFQKSHDNLALHEERLTSSPPIFLCFTLDGERTSYTGLDSVEGTAALVAHVSVISKAHANERPSHSNSSVLSDTQSVVAVELQAILDAYAAEQTLNAFRHTRSSCSNSDFRNAARCMKKSRSVSKALVRVDFYMSRTDQIHPSALDGGDSEIGIAFSLLEAELARSEAFLFTPMSPGRFLIDKQGEEASSLPFWCFVTIKRSNGAVEIETYHPDGSAAAESVSKTVELHIETSCHRVNQELMLRSLHRNRIASDLLIPNGDFPEASPSTLEGKTSKSEGNFRSGVAPGSFSCPVQFKAKYVLYHRCTSSQAVLSLEATALHSLAVLNRRGYFVYKDESDAILYMRLLGGSSADQSDSVDFIVYGLREPRESLTHQLNALLGRRLLTVGAEALSGVLTKNPHFNWKQADVDFVQSFRGEWQALGDDVPQDNIEIQRTYTIPEHVYDPVMLLIYFRQNLCGSTFFHLLHEATLDSDSIRLPLSCSDKQSFGAGPGIPFDKHDFSFFYNNAPSPLDPDLQPVSTLTAKGEQYSRETGTGIALIGIELLYRHGSPVSGEAVRSARDEGFFEQVDHSTLRVRQDEAHFLPASSHPPYRLRVRIVDTVIDSGILQDWVLLTLNQVLAAWSIEQHLLRTCLLSATPLDLPVTNVLDSIVESTNAEDDCAARVEQICPGFRLLRDMMEYSIDLPHPAIRRFEVGGMIRSSAVSDAACAMLDCVVAPLLQDTSQPSSSVCTTFACSLNDVWIVRLSRQGLPLKVKILRDPISGKSRLQQMNGAPIRDTPIDCPEYVFFYAHGSSLENRGDSAGSDSQPPMLFREVMAGDGLLERRSGMTEALLKLKESQPELFRRSFLFAFWVKRNRRLLWTYNWNPQVQHSVATRIDKVNATFVASTEMFLNVRQRRCLASLSPPVAKHKAVTALASPVSVDPQDRRISTRAESSVYRADSEPAASALPGSVPLGRDTARPTIRRPKLVGKSVEGAALQAVAASRARARAGSRRTAKTAPQKSPRDRPGQHRKSTGQQDSSTTRLKKDSGMLATAATVVAEDKKYLDSRIQSVLRQYAAAKQATMHVGPCSKSLRLAISKWWVSGPPEEPLVRKFLLSRSMAIWSSAFRCFEFPKLIAADFASYFAQWLVYASGGLAFAGEGSMETNKVTTASSVTSCPIILMELKRTEHGRLCMAVRIRSRLFVANGDHYVFCDCHTIQLPLEGSSVPRAQRQQRLVYANERNATLIDKKTRLANSTMNLEDQVFNFAGFLAERVLQSANEVCEAKEILGLIYSMLDRFPMSLQRSKRGLRYNVFQAAILLASFQNPHIDRFDAEALFDDLQSQSTGATGTVLIGESVCFNRQILECETVSYCFLIRQRTPSPKELQLVVLCRNDGRQLDDLTFRKSSPVAVSILDKILVAGAALAQDALEVAAKRMHQERLWEKLSSSSLPQYKPTQDDLCDILQLRSPLNQPLYEVLFGYRAEIPIDWHKLAICMSREPSFTPHRLIRSGVIDVCLSYVATLQVFLVLKISEDGCLSDAFLLSRGAETIPDELRGLMAQKLLNFLFHFTWQLL